MGLPILPGGAGGGQLYLLHLALFVFLLCLTLHCLALLFFASLLCFALLCLACLALPCLALPCLALPCLALPCLALLCFALLTLLTNRYYSAIHAFLVFSQHPRTQINFDEQWRNKLLSCSPVLPPTPRSASLKKYWQHH